MRVVIVTEMAAEDDGEVTIVAVFTAREGVNDKVEAVLRDKLAFHEVSEAEAIWDRSADRIRGLDLFGGLIRYQVHSDAVTETKPTKGRAND